MRVYRDMVNDDCMHESDVLISNVKGRSDVPELIFVVFLAEISKRIDL